MTAVPLPLRWAPREPPLDAAAVTGRAGVAERLRAATRDRGGAGSSLRAAATAEWIVVLGEAAELPWADGAVYLGWDSGVLVPTTVAPWPPAGLVRDALRRLTPDHCDLLVLLPEWLLASPMPVRPLDPVALTRAVGC
jgi:hypothetical protein